MSWTEKDWSNVIFTNESNFEILNRIYIRRFRNDLKRFERSQSRVHKGGGVGICSYLTCYGLGPIVFYDGSLNILIYWTNICQQHMKNSYHNHLVKFCCSKIMLVLVYQSRLKNISRKKRLIPFHGQQNSADLNLIENIWSVLDDKTFKI